MHVQRLTGPVDPLLLASGCDAAAAVVMIDGWTVIVGDPLDALTSLDELRRLDASCHWRASPIDGGPPFASGAVGMVTDAASPRLLDLPPPLPRPAAAALPDLWFGLYDSAVCVRPDGAIFAAAEDLRGLSTTPVAQRLRRWAERVESSRARSHEHDAVIPETRTVRSSLEPSEHAAAVKQAQEWIAGGDLYQLNLTFQVSVPWEHGGTALAHRLWSASPGAAHAAYLRLPHGVEIVSVSPETFLRARADTVTMRPVKGTRPRRDGVEHDREQAAQLLASTKDRAEHVMIVDLVRNDLGRVCEIGSVTVPGLAVLEGHPTVWHLTSTVRGQLRPEVDVADLLRATFPCGSVTGAPKRMAWQRITELEPVERGVYCGSIGALTRGRLDLSVAIRTAVVADGRASYGTGGGIVADSHADAELSEAMDKARAFLVATEVRESVNRGAP